MYCRNCGHKIEDDNVNFCPACGAALKDNTSEAREPRNAHADGSAFQNRSVVTVILLSIFTCGIYSIFWFYVTANDLNNADHTEEPLMNYILAILLGIVTLGIYQIYWLYKFFKKLDVVTGEQNLVLNLLMTFLFSSIVSSAIAQSSINKIAN